MNDTATQKGAARQEPPKDPDLKPGEVAVAKSPRDVALEAMADRQEQFRTDELNEAIASDPGLADQQRRIDADMRQAHVDAGIEQEPEAQPFDDGAASVTPIHEPTPDPAALPGNLQDDPLADFIEMRNGAPMVKAKVNGQDRLIPLADAKRQLQIGTAAEVRMQTAASMEANVKEREKRLLAGEAALSARMKATAQPPVPAQPDLTEEDLLEEAQDIFNTAFSGTEEDAAKKLAKTLAKIKRSATPVAQPQIDANEIAKQAASMVHGTLTAESKKKDIATGYQTFKSNYPEIIKDPNLFKMADDLTDEIERQHSDWSAAQIMDEAGKRTLAWVKNLTGQPQDTGNKPPSVPGDQNSPAMNLDTQTRQERKAGLVRMPTPAAGAQHHEPEPVDEDDQSPQQAFLELKKARGQPI